jgi:hypothetical protein
MQHAREGLERAGDKVGAEKLRGRMEKAAGGLHRDPQLEAALARAPELELKLEKDRAIGEALGKSLRPTANAIGD